jgi:hypothetical protein
MVMSSSTTAAGVSSVMPNPRVRMRCARCLGGSRTRGSLVGFHHQQVRSSLWPASGLEPPEAEEGARSEMRSQ